MSDDLEYIIKPRKYAADIVEALTSNDREKATIIWNSVPKRLKMLVKKHIDINNERQGVKNG